MRMHVYPNSEYLVHFTKTKNNGYFMEENARLQTLRDYDEVSNNTITNTVTLKQNG